MPDTPASPESEQIADVAINDEETIVRRPPLEGDGTTDEGDRTQGLGNTGGPGRT
jgi:hypothetical protein